MLLAISLFPSASAYSLSEPSLRSFGVISWLLSMTILSFPTLTKINGAALLDGRKVLRELRKHAARKRVVVVFAPGLVRGAVDVMSDRDNAECRHLY